MRQESGCVGRLLRSVLLLALIGLVIGAYFWWRAEAPDGPDAPDAPPASPAAAPTLTPAPVLDTAVAAIPPRALLYLSLDTTQAESPHMEQWMTLVAAWLDQPALAQAAWSAPLASRLAERTGLSWDVDVRPWLGQFVGWGMLDAAWDETGNLTPTVWLLAAEAADVTAADAFLARLAAAWAARHGGTAVTESQQGVTITAFDLPDAPLALARSGDLVLLANDADAIRQALAAQRGVSLADLPAYVQTVPFLSPGRFITLFAAGGRLTPLLHTLPDPPPTPVPPAALRLPDFGAGVWPQAEGVLLETMSQTGGRTLFRGAEPETAVRLPAETLFYVAGRGLDEVWARLKEGWLANDAAGFNEANQLMGEALGVNPDQDLFPYLDGEAALGLVPRSGGLGPDLPQWGLGGLVWNRTGAPGQVLGVLERFSTAVGDPEQGVGTVTQQQEGDRVGYQLALPALPPGVMIRYGVDGAWFFLGTEPPDAAAAASLADRIPFRQAALALGREPSWYVDVPGVMTAVGAEVASFDRVGRVLTAVETIAGSAEVTGEQVRTRTLITTRRP